MKKAPKAPIVKLIQTLPLLYIAICLTINIININTPVLGSTEIQSKGKLTYTNPETGEKELIIDTQDLQNNAAAIVRLENCLGTDINNKTIHEKLDEILSAENNGGSEGLVQNQKGTQLLVVGTLWGTSTTFSLSEPYTNYDKLRINWNGKSEIILNTSDIVLNTIYEVRDNSENSYTKFKFTSTTSITRTESSRTFSIILEGLNDEDINSSENQGDTPVLLWTNPSPNNTYSVGSVIDVDLSEYEYVIINSLGYYQTYPNYGITPCCIKVGESETYSPINTRTVTYTVTESSIIKSAVDSDTQSSNIGHQYFIPYQVYGINTDLRFINRQPDY